MLFAITGGLYTFKVGGSYQTESANLELELGSDPTLDTLIEAARTILKIKWQSSEPTGQAALKKAGTSWAFEWTGTRADFTLEPTAQPNHYKVALKRTTPHRFFVQLHKAKGGWAFKILAGTFAVGLILLFVSGVMIALARPALLNGFYGSLAAGTLAFILAAWLS